MVVACGLKMAVICKSPRRQRRQARHMTAVMVRWNEVSTLPEQYTNLSFADWWQQQGDWVEEPNERRDGQSGVQYLHTQDGKTLYSKRQCGHLSRSLRYPFGRPTVVREHLALEAYRAAGVQVPRLVFAGSRKQQGVWQGLLVTEELKGFISMDQWYAENAPSVQGNAVHQQMLRELAKTLSLAHVAGWQHGCLYSKHVFIRVRDQDVEIALLDLEKARHRLRHHAAVRHDLKQFYRHRGPMPEADWFALLRYYRAIGSIEPTQKLLGAKTPVTSH